MADVEDANCALVECHAQVLRKRPQDWLEVIKGVGVAMDRFRSRMASQPGRWTPEMDGLHAAMAGRLEFYHIKLRAIEGYAHTTLERLNIQRDALSSVMAHRESLVNLQMAAVITDQRRIAQASKRDGNALKRLSMLGAIFLPGTFLASLFSMAFFDFPTDEQGAGVRVSPQVWIYFAIMAPMTLAVVAVLWVLDRKTKNRVKRRTAALEAGLEAVEREMAVQTRRQTASGKTVAFEEEYE